MAAIKRGIGFTPTEKTLAALADRIFLNLWSSPNLFKSDGEELCDLLVACGDDVLIFSDKNIAWPTGDDFSLSWSRWYRRAIEESAAQINGAARYLREHPTNCFSMPLARRNSHSPFRRSIGGGRNTSRSPWALSTFADAQMVSVDGNLLLSWCNTNINRERTA